MNKIAIITAATLPVPSVRGGAVETLINQLLKENEKQIKLNITVYSVYDSDAIAVASGYKNSEFIFFHTNHLSDRYFDLICRIIWKFFKIKINNKLFFIYKVVEHIKKSNYDVVLVENRPEFVLPILKKNDAKIILHVHNDNLGNSTTHKKKIISKCNKVLTVSEFIKNKLLSLGEITDGKIDVLKNCTDITLFNKELYKDYRDEFRREHNIQDEDIVILFSGRLHEVKGIKELLLAFQKLELDNIWLLIVGSTWFGDNKKDNFVRELEELSHDFSQRIIFTGFFPYDDMPRIYAASNIAVVPSIWDDPAPLVVLEAMATGLPLIVTDSGGIPEYVNEECAILVKRDFEIVDNLAAAMRELIIKKDLRDNMGKASKVYVKQFNSEKYYENFVKIVAATLEES